MPRLRGSGVRRMKDATRRRVIQGLRVAIDTAESWIDACTTGLRIRKGRPESYVPEEHKKDVARYRRDIKAWQKAIEELTK